MARARNIKPGLFRNEILGVADPLYTLLFEGLWLLADREGRLEDRPLRIKGDVFPYRDGIDVNAMLGWLEGSGFIRRYRVSGLALIHILKFTKHQNPHKNEPPSEFPSEPEEIGRTTEEIGSAPADPGFRIPDSGLLEKPQAAPAAPPPIPDRKPRKPAKTLIPEDFGISDRVRKWAERKGYGQLEQHLEAFIRKCKAKGYENVSWDDAFMEAIREDWAKLRGKTINGVAPPAEARRNDSAEETARMLADKDKGTRTMPAELRGVVAQLTGRKAA